MNTEALIETAKRRQLPPPPVRRALRQATSTTQREMAEAIGVDPATVCRWETGARTPRGAHRLAYAQLLKGLSEVVS